MKHKNFDRIPMDIQELTRLMHQFVQDKGWYDEDSIHPQTPRNLAISLSIEAAEILELYQWENEEINMDALESEVADVMLYLLQLASIQGIDIEKAVQKKLKKNYGRDWS